jgi:hypothetical protein
VWEDLSCIDSGHPCGVNLFAAWEEEGGFGTIVIYDRQDGIEALLLWQIHDKIPTNRLKGVGMYFHCHDGVNGDLGSHRVWLGTLTNGTSLHVLDNEAFHIWPPVVSRHACIRIEDSGMSCTFMIMIHAENALLQWQVISHHWPSSFEPVVIDGDEFMILCPLLYL